ncbi:MAG: DUF3631 domain-containing protein [Xanthobacteraceae bacterium]
MIRKPSWHLQLLAEFRNIFAAGRKEILSKEFVDTITADPTSVWRAYNRGGPITQRQVAVLLSEFEIYPVSAQRQDITRSRKVVSATGNSLA